MIEATHPAVSVVFNVKGNQMSLTRSLVIIATLLLSVPAWAGVAVEPFEGISNYSLIVTDDANLGSGVHIHGGLYVGGDLTYSGANTSVGSDISDDSTGLVVAGDINATQQLDLMGTNYYIGGSSSVALNNAGDEVTSNPVSSDDIQSLIETSQALSELEDSGVTVNASDINGITFTLTEGELNVINLDASTASYLSTQNAALIFSGFTSDTYLLINYDLSTDLTFVAKILGLSEEYYSNIIWNFVGSATLTVANSVSTFKGSILAPDSSVIWQANDIDGQLIAKNLTWLNTSQSHYYTPWSPKTPTDPQSTPIPVPPVLWLFAIGLFGMMHIRRKSRAET